AIITAAVSSSMTLYSYPSKSASQFMIQIQKAVRTAYSHKLDAELSMTHVIFCVFRIMATEICNGVLKELHTDVLHLFVPLIAELTYLHSPCMLIEGLFTVKKAKNRMLEDIFKDPTRERDVAHFLQF
ncbi:hypothetical protein ACJX0J_026325, partial [Zea mays]